MDPGGAETPFEMHSCFVELRRELDLAKQRIMESEERVAMLHRLIEDLQREQEIANERRIPGRGAKRTAE